MPNPVLSYQRAGAQVQPYVPQPATAPASALSQAWPDRSTGPYARIGSLAQRYTLEAEEVARLCRVLREWPPELIEQGIDEELEDVLAGRNLARLNPLTVEDALAIRKAIARCVRAPAS